MAVYRYNQNTGRLDAIEPGNTQSDQYFDIGKGEWVNRAAPEPEVHVKEDAEWSWDRWDKTKKVWVQDTYKNGELDRTLERTWASAPMKDTHSPLCECHTCEKAKGVARIGAPDEPRAASHNTPSGAYAARRYRSEPVTPTSGVTGAPGTVVTPDRGMHYPYKSYTPTLLHEGVDRKKWPNTWQWLVTFYFQPDYYRNTRNSYISSEGYYGGYGD